MRSGIDISATRDRTWAERALTLGPEPDAPRPRTISAIPTVGTHGKLRDVVQRMSVDALSVTWDADAESLARRSLDESGLLLLGEVHGVAENAAAIRTLVERLGVGVLALEWPTELVPLVQRFTDDGELTDDRLLWLGDGRITAEHFAVLRELFAAGVAIRLIDERLAGPDGSWTELDQQLAGAVLRRTRASEPTLVVCGNAHTPTHRTEHGQPMGAWIARARPGVREVRIEYGGGGYFNLGSRTFTSGPDRSPQLRLTGGRIRLTIGRAHEAHVPFAGRLSPSRP